MELHPVHAARGYYLAQALHARRTQPPGDVSAMDGYAVASDDIAGPWSLIGESAAGHPFVGAVAKGQAARISTGALMPAGAGAVVLQEDVEAAAGWLRLSGAPPFPSNKHVRPAGMDFREGAEVLPAGARIGPAQMALAVSAGFSSLPVHAKPRVAVLDSGDELAASPETCAQHQIPASNGVMLAAMIGELPCEVRRIGPVPDRLDALGDAFAQTLDVDVLVTSGGASVGDHDLLRPALEASGARIDFWRVAIKPGKPLLVATRERRGKRQIIVGLPGNPVSGHVTAFLFVLPLLRHMLGATRPLPVAVRLPVDAALPAGGARREFLRANWDGARIFPTRSQDSGALGALAASNALIDRPANSPPSRVGDLVNAYMLGNGGIA